MAKKFENENRNKTERWLDFLAVLLLFSLITTAAARLVATRWVENLNVMHPITFFALLAGLALGYSRFSGRISWIFGLLYGAFVIPWQMGLVMTEGVEWKERLLSMAGRLSLVLGELFERKPVTDNIFFLVLMGIMFWVLAIYAAYHLVRTGNVWLVIIPSGLVTFLVHSFDPLLAQRAWYIAVYIFLGLLMLSRITFMTWRRDWARRRSHIPPDVAFDISRSMVILTTVTVLIAWNIPSLSNSLPIVEDMYKTASQPFFSARDRFSYMFAALRSSVGLVSDYYGDQQGLGQGQPKSNDIVMTVEGPRDPYLGSRFYWRARVYDEYSNGRWINNLDERRLVAPDQPDLVIADSPGRLEGEFTFKPMQAIVSLYAPPQPVWFSRPGQIQYATNPGAETASGEVDLVGMRAQPYIHAGEVYEVRSRLSSVTVLELRESGSEYPEWVSERYLQIPETTTERTRTLAEQITRGLENPYDKAVAVTNWLRSNIQYTEVINPPPTDRDVLDWFLFDYRKGFCNYYATAEVILLRLAGVPARWAVGYAQGESQAVPGGKARDEESAFGVPDRALYIVREIDAHSWPEIYFAGVGWIEFEPTVSQQPIFRPSGEVSSNASNDTTDPQDRGPDRSLEGELEPTPFPDDGPGTQTPSFGSDADWLQYVGPALAAAGALLIVGLLVIVRRKQNTVMVFWVKMIGGDENIVAQWQSENLSLWEQLERSLALMLSGKPAYLADSYDQKYPTRILGLQVPSFLRNWAAYVLLPTIFRAFHEVNRMLVRLGKAPAVHATPGERVDQLIQIVPEAQQSARELLAEYQTAIYSPYQADPQKARSAADSLKRLSLKAWWRKITNRFLSSLQD